MGFFPDGSARREDRTDSRGGEYWRNAPRLSSKKRLGGWRLLVQAAVGMGIPVLAVSASLAYFDGYRSERLPANLTQAQRDFFGAHPYRRIDKEGTFHTEWTPISTEGKS